jgi:tRNA-2-methylthio-N6-dimethylallyladenosine synthase
MRFFIRTYGCQMNESDSERIAWTLTGKGHEMVGDEGKADLIILNTCAVRESAERKVWGKLGRLAELKRRKPDLLIAVGGCMGQSYGEEIVRRFPHVDLVFGTRSFVRLPDLIEERLSAGRPVVDISETSPPFTPQLRGGKPRAWVSISTGCDNFCSYCIVPYVRGRETHRSVDEILQEVRALAEGGYKEVTLLGQNVNSYRWKGLSFPDLLRYVDEVDGIERIRFVTSHPKDVPDELIEAMAQLEKVCEHLHLPAQSGSNAVLRRMNRGYTKAQFLKIVNRLRERIPHAAITSDFIVGFPGEGERDFEETISLVEEVRFDYAFCYRYSDRPGTKAATMEGRIPEHVKRRRLERLIELTQRIALERNRELLGDMVEVLVEGINPKISGELMGRTRTNKPVFFKGDLGAIGSILKVRVTEASYWFLRGEVEDGDPEILGRSVR